MKKTNPKRVIHLENDCKSYNNGKNEIKVLNTNMKKYIGKIIYVNTFTISLGIILNIIEVIKNKKVEKEKQLKKEASK